MTLEPYEGIQFLLRFSYHRRATSSNDPIAGSPSDTRRSASTFAAMTARFCLRSSLGLMSIATCLRASLARSRAIFRFTLG